MRRLILFVAFFVTIKQVYGNSDIGFGCMEADLPNEVRRDCLEGDLDPQEEACRRKGCVWCDKRDKFPGTPPCFFRDTNYEPLGLSCDQGYVKEEERVDCAAGQEIDEINCLHKNCTWCPSYPSGVPFCFQSSSLDSTGYLMVGQPVNTTNGVRVMLTKSKQSRAQFGGEANDLTFEAFFESDYRLRIKITNNSDRFEVPIQINPPTGGNGNPLYEIDFPSTVDFSFRVKRKSSGAILFNSAAGKLSFADQFLSMSWNVPTENVYGLGENEQRTFKHDFREKYTYSLYASDMAPSHTAPLYGVHPHFTVIEEDGSVHALAIINSNAQEFKMIPGPTIKYITIGGVFDFMFFLGPTPDDTVAQYTEAVGRAQMPPYWGLGFQLCRWGYDSLENMKAAVNRTEVAGIPHDVQYGDIDIMRDELDFTYDDVPGRWQGLPDYIRELKTKGIKFVTILDPFISIIEGPEYTPYPTGNELDVWYKTSAGIPAVGRVWPHDGTAPVFFPDYSKNSTRQWWINQLIEFQDLLEYDGIWIDMNEPANFEHGSFDGCEPNLWNYPPYKPGDRHKLMHYKTLCGDFVDSVSIHYNTHSLYGWFMSEPTLEGVRQGTGKRGLVLSRSTFLGSGKWATHWLGDNWSRWGNLHHSIIGILQYNMFGIPYVGADICGFIGTGNSDMCKRWMELGAFYPFSRNHNIMGEPDQDPGVWPDVAEASKKALEVRYTLIPYLYTLFFKHVTEGSTVFRALWYNYVQDRATYNIDRQFMWGSGLLVSPALDEGQVEVQAYFPNGRFYSYYDGAEVSTRGGIENLAAPADFIPVHIAGGNILPTQEPARNTDAARLNPMGLIVALNDFGYAHGALFYDDGNSIETHLSGEYFYAEYEMAAGRLSSNITQNGYIGMAAQVFGSVRLLGFETNVTSVIVNGVPHPDFETTETGEVVVTNLALRAINQFVIVFA